MFYTSFYSSTDSFCHTLIESFRQNIILGKIFLCHKSCHRIRCMRRKSVIGNNPEKAMQRRCWYVSQETCLNGNAYSFSELEWMGLVCMFCRKSAAAVWNGLPQFLFAKFNSWRRIFSQEGKYETKRKSSPCCSSGRPYSDAFSTMLSRISCLLL